MKPSLPVQVLGPALLSEALAALLSPMEGVDVVQNRARVVLLAGPDWSARLQSAREDGDSPQRGVALVTNGDHRDFQHAGRLGIDVFLGWEDSAHFLRQGLDAAAHEQAFCSPTVLPVLLQALRSTELEAQGIPAHRGLPLLSQRELEVALHASGGCSNLEIAEELHLSVATVKFHLSHVFRKLGICRRSQLSASLSVLETTQDSRVHCRL